MADIVLVRHRRLRDLREDELVLAGFESAQEAEGRLAEFYRDFTLDSEVTFIQWANVRGRLTEEA